MMMLFFDIAALWPHVLLCGTFLVHRGVAVFSKGYHGPGYQKDGQHMVGKGVLFCTAGGFFFLTGESWL